MLQSTSLRLLKKYRWIFVVPWIALGVFWWQQGREDREAHWQQLEETKKVADLSEQRGHVAHELGPFFLHGQFPTETDLQWDGQAHKVHVDYSLDPVLQAEADKLLRTYHPDYGAVVIMDALTGRVKAMASFEKEDPTATQLALRGTFPAASVFKIVTATAAIDKYKISPDTIVFFNGANYTLYRKNVLETRRTRWTRGMTIREAFARSINTVFGRLTLEKLEPQDIEDYAVRFGFNKKIQSDLPFDPGFTEVPHEKAFHLAEIASGYNTVTRMSPLQGAMIASSVAAAGRMPVPTIVDRIVDESGKELYKSEPVVAAVTMTPEGAEHLKEMMEGTITHGTSRKAFRPLMRDKHFRELELGGKTGSLTGDNPRGKVDWFVGYAIGGAEDRLAIAAITVNVQKWTVKSSHLAQSLFIKHFKDQFSERSAKFFNAAQPETTE